MMNKLLLTLAISLLVIPAWAGKSTINLPVPKETIRKGEMITTAMLTHRSYDERRVGRQVVDHPAALVGMQATRTLRARAPVFENAVRVPPEVRKNKPVTIRYAIEGLRVTAKAKAVEDGFTGDMIKVQNPHSGKVIFAEVTGPNQVVLRK